MLKSRKPDSLSIWEIATRLHGLDPEASLVDSLPLDVRDTLRSLITTQERNLNISDVDGNELLPRLIPIINVVKEHPVSLRLGRMAKDRKYDKEFLDSIYIIKDEFEYLMLIQNRPLPSFWFSDDEIEYHNEKRFEIHGELSENKVSTPQAKPKSTRHIKAAQIKHAPQKQVFEQFFAFYKTETFPSKAQAARIFLATLPADKLNLFSVERVEKTFTDALRAHLKSKPSSK